MSGGGTTTTSSNTPPPQVLDAYVNATNQASNVAATPFQTPQAPVAGLNAAQTQGINGVVGAQGAADPYINQAEQFIGQSNAPLNGALPYEGSAENQVNTALEYNPANTFAPYAGTANNLYGASTAPVTAGQVQAGQVSPTQFSAGQLNQYLSPYNNDVINATQAEFNNQNAQQQQGVVGNAISAGAWGGDRSAVAQGITAGQQQLAEAPVIAGLENQNYSQALGEFNTQQQTGLAAQEANQQTGLQGQEANQTANLQALEASRGLQQSAAAGIANVGGTAAQQQTAESNTQLNAANANLGIGQQALGGQEAQGWLASQGAYASANLGNEALNSDLTQANAEIGAGTLAQQQEQAELNAPYEEQLAQLAYPFQTSQFLTNSVEGLGAGQGGTSSTNSPGPSTGSQVAGLATSALGIAAIAGLLKDGGAVKRAGGGIVPGLATNVPGMGSGISGVVNIVPETTGTSVHGMGVPAPPHVQQQPDQMQGLNNTIMNIGMMKNRGGGGGGMAAAGPDAMAQEAAGNAGEYGIASGEGEGLGLMAAAKRGGGIPRLGIGGMVHMPAIHAFKPPHMGGGIAGGHAMFHPPGLKLAPGGSIDVSQPDQTGQEVQMQNAGQDEANAMAVAMATSGTGIAPMMNTPTAQARGGGVARRADGGAVDDGAWDSDSPPVTISGSPSDTTGNTLGVGGPPAPPSPEAQQGAVQTSVTPAGDSGGIGRSGKPPSNSDIWGTTLLAAGLGMLGGTSPYAGVNIGRGGLEGMQFGESIKNREENMQLRQTQQEQNNLYRKDMLTQQGLYRQQMAAATTKRADTGQLAAQQRHEDRQDQMNNNMSVAQMREAAAAEKTANAAGKDHWTYTGTDADGNALLLSANTGEIKTTNTKIGLKPEVQAGIDQRGQRLGLAQQYQQWKMQHGDATAAETADWHASLRQQGYTNEDIKMLEGSKDITGTPTMTPQAAHTAAQKLRESNGSPGAAPASPAALADPLGIR